MWRDKQINFLTESECSELGIINILEEYNLKIKDVKEKQILNQIINDFRENNFSLLTSQEMNYLLRNSKEKWAPYIIHRYKFHYYENNTEMPDFPLYLILEPVSSCNLRCPFCMQSEEKFTSNKDTLPM